MGKLTVEQLRRKASAAKAVLSRYQNQLDDYMRQSGHKDHRERQRLFERVLQQQKVFKQAVHDWKESQ